MTQPISTPRQSVIAGERIYLSTFQVEDVPTLTRWFSQLDVTAFIGMQGTAYTREQEQQWMKIMSSNQTQNSILPLSMPKPIHLLAM